MTQLLVTASTEASSTGKFSSLPSRKQACSAPAVSAFFLADASISGVMSIPMTFPSGPTFRAAISASIPAPDPRSTMVSPSSGSDLG
jgi:hypothetical protein